MKINYVIACWSGLRRVNSIQYIDKRECFLEAHLNQLIKIDHHLDQITLVINDNEEEPKSYSKFVESIPSNIRGAKVKIIKRRNIGFSYGGYSKVYGIYRREFDYYIFMEDDYAFVLDNFDDILLKFFDNPNCGFVTSQLMDGGKEWIKGRIAKVKLEQKFMEDTIKYCPDEFKYALVTVGMLSSEVLELIWEKFGQLPYADVATHEGCKVGGQFCITAAVQKVGKILLDVIPSYSIKINQPNGNIDILGPLDKPLMWIPVQDLI